MNVIQEKNWTITTKKKGNGKLPLLVVMENGQFRSLGGNQLQIFYFST